MSSNASVLVVVRSLYAPSRGERCADMQVNALSCERPSRRDGMCAHCINYYDGPSGEDRGAVDSNVSALLVVTKHELLAMRVPCKNNWPAQLCHMRSYVSSTRSGRRPHLLEYVPGAGQNFFGMPLGNFAGFPMLAQVCERLSILCTILLWFVVRRIGEASNPGPVSVHCLACQTELRPWQAGDVPKCMLYCESRMGKRGTTCDICGTTACGKCTAGLRANRDDALHVPEPMHNRDGALTPIGELPAVEIPLPPELTTVGDAAESSTTPVSQAGAVGNASKTGCKKACPCGDGWFSSITFSAKARCSDCHTWRRRGAHAWRCGACNKKVCLECRNQYPMWGIAGSQVVADSAPSGAERYAEVRADDEQHILEILERVRADPAFFWPPSMPGRARRRLGVIGRNLLRELLGKIAAKANDSTLRLCTLMLMYCYPAVLGQKSDADWLADRIDGHGQDPFAEASVWKQVQKRLQLAEKGEWHQLFASMLETVYPEATEAEAAQWIPRAVEVGTQDDACVARMKREATAMSKVKGGCVRTAVQILKPGGGVLPPCDDTANQVKGLMTLDMTDQEREELQDALKQANASSKKVTIRKCTVRAKVDKLRDAAQPGLSRTRNDLIKAIADVPGGVDVLLEWCQLWANADVPTAVSELLTEQMVRPLEKSNGKARPISLLEVFLKFASGVIQDTLRNTPDAEGLSWNQYGAQPAGPETMLMVGNALMEAMPMWAFASLDFSNAFGTASRAAMLRSTSEWCPGHAKFLCNLWRGKSFAWIEKAPSEWERVEILDGAYQGDTSSAPSFSRALRLVERAVREEAERRGIQFFFLSLHDDVLVACEPSRVDELIGIIATLARDIAKLSLNCDKCHAYVPSWDQEDSRPANYSSVIQSVPVCFYGLPALGCAYAGEFETVLGPFAAAAEPARKRLENARHVAEECKRIAHGKHDGPTKQAVWCILQKCVSRALQYDLRVLEKCQVMPLAEELDKIVVSAAQALTDSLQVEWSALQIRQAQWPACVSGLGLGSAAAGAKVGRIACVAQCLPTARSHLRMFLPDITEEVLLQLVPLEQVKIALEELREEGIELTATGAVAMGMEPRLNVEQHFQPIRGIVGLVVKHMFVAERDGYVREASASSATTGLKREAARLLSCEGGGGFWIEAIPTRRSLRLTDEEFVTGLRYRLGLAQIPVDGQRRCQLQSEAKRCATDLDDAEGAQGVCGHCLDPFLDHALCCPKGNFYLAHTAIGRRLAAIGKEAGCQVASEVVVPQLLKGEPGSANAEEARLDLHFWDPGPNPAEWFVDVTIHNAWSAKYRKGGIHAGRVAKDAEDSKFKRYGIGEGGVTVTPAAVESWGRFGQLFERLLSQLTARWAYVHGAQQRTAQTTRRRWSAELGVALVRAQCLVFRRATTCRSEAAVGSV